MWRRAYVSPNIVSLTGYNLDCCLGPLPAAMGAADAAGVAIWDAAVGQALESGAAMCNFSIRHANGHVMWLRAALKARGLDGGTALLTGYAVDITTETELAEALESARRDLEEAVASGPGWLYRMSMAPDGSYRTEYVSDNIQRMTGYSAAEAMAPGWLDSVIDPGALPMIAEAAHQLVRDGRVASEYRMRTKSGTWIWVGNTLSAYALPDGRTRAIGYAADITELKERTAQLQQASRLAVLGEMAAGMAHELRQPLSGISFAAQNAEYALDRNDIAKTRQRLSRIVQQTERASHIIEHLREFARGADAKASPVPVAVRELVDSTLALIGETLRLQNVAVTVALDDPPPVVLGRAMPLEQVLMNLLLNARDALLAHEMAEPRRIAIAARREGGNVAISVSDNGGGIQESVLPLLFQPFVTTKLADKGTGLGLSICHGIVSNLGGSIRAHNEAGGAVFTILLPAAG